MNQSITDNVAFNLSKAAASIALKFDVSPDMAMDLAENWAQQQVNPQWDLLREAILAGDVIYLNQGLQNAPFSNDSELRMLITHMKGADGLNIEDRWYYFKRYPQCFIGRDAVTWLSDTQNVTRASAVNIGERLVRRGIIQHVVNEHNFKDDYLFYRFI